MQTKDRRPITVWPLNPPDLSSLWELRNLRNLCDTLRMQTDTETADQTSQSVEVPDEHLPAIRHIRRQMTKDGMDWRTTQPTKRYCIQMALASGREKCGDALGMKLRDWVQTAPWSPEDDLEEQPVPVAAVEEVQDETETGPDLADKRSGLRGLFARRPRSAEPDPEPEPEPEPQVTEQTTPQTAPERSKLGRLRFVPPIASLGLSAVMQVIIVTDVLGKSLIARYDTNADDRQVFYAIAFVFGIGIACALEGSAAYLLDLYRKHLLAQDSVFTLRLMILGYVGGSAALIHWWTGNPKVTPGQLPWVLASVLSVLAGSSIMLWIMGSKWENRERMRANGQLDKAMPRFAGAAKIWNPIRWLQTIKLTSWDPAETTAEARERHADWTAVRQTRKQAKRSAKKSAKD